MALSTFLRGEIIGMFKAGKKSPDIAIKLGVNERTVRRIITNYKKRGTVETKKSPGRPRKLNDRDVRSLVSIVHKNHRATLSEITKEFPTKVSRSTVRRTLGRLNIFSRSAVVKPHRTA